MYDSVNQEITRQSIMTREFKNRLLLYLRQIFTTAQLEAPLRTIKMSRKEHENVSGDIYHGRLVKNL